MAEAFGGEVVLVVEVVLVLVVLERPDKAVTLACDQGMVGVSVGASVEAVRGDDDPASTGDAISGGFGGRGGGLLGTFIGTTTLR